VSRALRLARSITRVRSSGVSSSQCNWTSLMPGSDSTLDSQSRFMVALSGQPAVVSAIVICAVCPLSETDRTMPKSTMLSFNSGSITPRKTPRISFSSTVSSLTSIKASYLVRCDPLSRIRYTLNS